MYKCEKCNKEFEKRKAYIGHCSSHNRGDSYKLNRKKSEDKKSIEHKCQFCDKEFDNGAKLGGHVRFCKKNPNILENKKSCYRKHSEISKIKMSNTRLKYLKENPDKHPWKYLSKFTSIPCEHFKELLTNRGIMFDSEYKPLENRMFSVDVVILEKKIGIEINGNQHYDYDGNLKPYYQERHNLIVAAGWELLEIPSKKVYNKEFVEELINLLK